ncbi:hypothetical protein SDC9_155686 [bioreactor metagenome]|uniref:Uncharacterized protein n=1 Tax=bioreactor metagenome TaxID=1076179 RepID=A0A645F709_9ZZZZ
MRQIKSFNAVRMMVAGFVILFMALSYGNVDGMIAKYNIARYENGTLNNLDIEALAQLSEASVPYIYKAYQNTSNQNLKADLKNILVQSSSGEDSNLFVDPETFRNFNFQDRTADEIARS